MINTKHIRITHEYGEVSPNTFPDFNWTGEHYQALLDQYGEAVILVYEKKVIGIGKTLSEAVEDAEARLPNNYEGELTPIIYHLAHLTPFLRVRPTITKAQE